MDEEEGEVEAPPLQVTTGFVIQLHPHLGDEVEVGVHQPPHQQELMIVPPFKLEIFPKLGEVEDVGEVVGQKQLPAERSQILAEAQVDGYTLRRFFISFIFGANFSKIPQGGSSSKGKGPSHRKVIGKVVEVKKFTKY